MGICVRELMAIEDKSETSESHPTRLLSEAELSTGDLEVVGRLVDASNATLFGKIKIGEAEQPIVYKPIAGERPLWDFPSGNLASREVAAYIVSRELGFDLVPTTVMRNGPFGEGAVQQWIEVDESLDLIAISQTTGEDLRGMALFDVIVNNTDRKFGHILVDNEGQIFGCDHGVTFHVQPKLRTVLWQFAGDALSRDEVLMLEGALIGFETLKNHLSHLISEEELVALRGRLSLLLEEGVFPYPSEEWPAVPWPPF